MILAKKCDRAFKSRRRVRPALQSAAPTSQQTVKRPATSEQIIPRTVNPEQIVERSPMPELTSYPRPRARNPRAEQVEQKEHREGIKVFKGGCSV